MHSKSDYLGTTVLLGLLQLKRLLYSLLVLVGLVLGILVSWRELTTRKAETSAIGLPAVTQPSDNLIAAISGLLTNESCNLLDATSPQRTRMTPSETTHGFEAALVQMRLTLNHPGGRTPFTAKGSGRGPNAMSNAEADLIRAARASIRATAPACINGD